MTDKKTLLFPILLITFGTGWLLTTVGVAPGIDWIWTLGLAVLGLLTFFIGGVDKITVVIGPFLLVASSLSIFRQTGRLHIDLEMPLLIIFLGILVLIARMPSIPVPKWIIQEK